MCMTLNIKHMEHQFWKMSKMKRMSTSAGQLIVSFLSLFNASQRDDTFQVQRSVETEMVSIPLGLFEFQEALRPNIIFIPRSFFFCLGFFAR